MQQLESADSGEKMLVLEKMRETVEQRTHVCSDHHKLHSTSNQARAPAAEAPVEMASGGRDSSFVIHTNPEDIFCYEPDDKPQKDTIVYSKKDIRVSFYLKYFVYLFVSQQV